MDTSLSEFERQRRDIDNLSNVNIVTEGLLHDFSNFLATISGLSQLSMLKTNSEELKENLATINKVAFACKLTLDNINSYLKGNYEAIEDDHFIDDLINRVVDITKHKIRTLQILENKTIEVELCLCSNQMIRCNDYEIKRVLLNLILNAIDAMDEKGGILKIRSYKEDGCVVTEVIDTGIGMDEYTKKNIFDPYFTTKESKGTGLGLSIVKDILDSHGATIKVESVVDQGSKFTIVFPDYRNRYIVEDTIKVYNII